MQIFLVGGAVRDALLGLPVQDRDFVVVGTTPEQMRASGYRQVGRDFPVFLHPQSSEEYALARTERKTAPGHQGFVFDTRKSVRLEDDLARRDLTINAIAQGDDGTLVDPFDGQGDLERRVLRHVTEAFAEDPLRVFRVARFAARLAPFGFAVAPETLALMRSMAASGELRMLSAERVMTELEKALFSASPARFFLVLREAHALADWFAELEALFGVPQHRRYHPEIDAGVHTMLALERLADSRDAALATRVAVLCHDFGKAQTPRPSWPRHHQHESLGLAPVRLFCERLRAPRLALELSLWVAENHLRVHRALELRPATVLKLLSSLDALRRPERLEQALLACQCDWQGRWGQAQRSYPQADLLRDAAMVARGVDVAALRSQGLEGAQLGEAIRQRQIEAIRQLWAGESDGSPDR